MALLDEALALEGNKSLQPGKVILVKDGVATSGAFVLHHFLKKMLTGSSDAAEWIGAMGPNVLSALGVVLFVGLSEPFSHYERIVRKLGCNLAAHRDNGQFIFLDMLHLDHRGSKEGTKSVNGLFELYKHIHQALQKCISSERKMGGICIMIDDVSLLEIAAYGSEDHVLDFLHYCRILTSELGCSLVLLAHQDIYVSMIDSSFIQHLEYCADTVINVEPLNTGLAADVHGQLTVIHRVSPADSVVPELHSALRRKLHNFHFKIKENAVEYFPPGMQI
eukprot:Gb_24524 [translate_table: standard]